MLIAQELWSMVIILFGVLWVMPRGLLELLASWQGRFSRSGGVVWNVIPHCIMWCLRWREMLGPLKDVKNLVPISSFPASNLYLSG